MQLSRLALASTLLCSLSSVADAELRRPRRVRAAAAPKTAVIELRRNATVYAEPEKSSEELGKIPKRTRLVVAESRRGGGCKYRWRRIEPVGWICAKSKPTKKEATTVALPKLQDGELPTQRYGRVAKRGEVMVYESYRDAKANIGAPPEKPMSVLRKRLRRIDGKRFWQTAGGKFIESRFIRTYRPSSYQGILLDAHHLDGDVLVGWARPLEKGADVMVYAEPSLDGEVIAHLPAKSEVELGAESSDGVFVSIGAGEWILRDETRKATRREPPAEIRGDEFWIDVNLDEQVLVAYRGTVPMYATMVSSGTRKHRTPVGKYRIQRKVAQKTMASGEDSDEQYSVGGVPWVMYIHKTYALHGAYWHDRVGAPRSHGCVNLAPKDAQFLYDLAQPHVPDGWLSANATEENPGTLIHIRSARKPKSSSKIRYN